MHHSGVAVAALILTQPLVTRRAMSAPATKSVPAAKPTPGMPDKIGKYVVIKEVGRGSTGIV